MELPEQVTVQFRVVSCAELPKTNLLGTINPFIRVLYDGNILGETRHLKNQQAPVWEEDLFFDALLDEQGCLLGVVRLELYNDNGSRQAELVASVDIELSEIPPETVNPHRQQQIEFYDYALGFQPDKRGEKLARQGRVPQVTVAVVGSIPSWSSLVAQLEGFEEELGLLVCEDTHQLFVPLPGGEAAGLYGGIQYLLPRAVHFKLATTSKQHAGLHLDFKCSKARSLVVERHVHTRRRRLAKGLKVYAEATLTNLSLSTDLRKLQLIVTNRRAVSSCNLGQTLEAAGFPANAFGSALTYKRVAKDMGAGGGGGGVLLDDAASCIFIPAGKPPYRTLLQLDFSGEGLGGGGGGGGSGRADGGGGGSNGSGRMGGFLGGGAARPALRALSVKGLSEAQGRNLLFDFVTSCSETLTVSEAHRRAFKAAGGQHEVTRAVELPGLFDDDKDELYDAAMMVCYVLEAAPIASCSFSELFEPPPEEEPSDSDGGFFSTLDPADLTVGNMAAMMAQQGGKVVNKVVDGLGTLVGRVGAGVNEVGGGAGEAASAAGEAVLKVFKAPLKLFRGRKSPTSSLHGEDSVNSLDPHELQPRDRRRSGGAGGGGRQPSNNDRSANGADGGSVYDKDSARERGKSGSGSGRAGSGSARDGRRREGVGAVGGRDRERGSGRADHRRKAAYGVDSAGGEEEDEY